MFALDFLGVLFADGVLLGSNMALIGTPPIGVEAGEAKELQKRVVFQTWI